MNTVNRDKDIVSGNNDLEPLFSLKNFPGFMGCVDHPQTNDIFSDMNFYISKSSGMIQLNPLLPLDVVYQAEHNPGTAGKAWFDHHNAFATFILRYSPNNVFEIGGAHGILSDICYSNKPNIKWTILEPNPIPISNLKAKITKGFFDENTSIPDDIDMIVHSHVLEHIYEPTVFFNNLKTLKLGTKMCFSIPNLKKHLEKKYTYILSFEHTYYCTEEYVDWWLLNNGFDLLDKQYYSDDFSIFYACQKNEKTTKTEIPSLYERNKDLFIQYTDLHLNLVHEINKKITNIPNPIFLFGAHVFNQFLLSFGLDRKKIKCLLDNNISKQGKRLYGTDLTVQSPLCLKTENNPVVILRTGVFNEEIKKDILNNINPNTIFLE
jgi:2-polyprenyl-3-methyl-5-hydroxy-6-metoxy-1,4-benzoquinol methylase